MENVRNRIDMKLVNDRKKKAKLVKKINFKHATHFGEKLAAVHMRKTKVVLDKPIFCGAAILDLSKCEEKVGKSSGSLFRYRFSHA